MAAADGIASRSRRQVTRGDAIQKKTKEEVSAAALPSLLRRQASDASEATARGRMQRSFLAYVRALRLRWLMQQQAACASKKFATTAEANSFNNGASNI